MPEIRLGAATDTGNYRNQNEDALLATPGLVAVADGMGGHNAGEVASAMAIARLREHVEVGVPSADELVSLVRSINETIHAEATATTEQRGMGTTLTVATLDLTRGSHLHLANVGDSRGYLARAGRLRQLTVDHSYVQELVTEGLLTQAEARRHPRRNIVTRALGIDPEVAVDSWTVALETGDRLLLCSDGLVDEVDDERIAAILAEHVDPAVAATRLVEEAKASGGRDNISVIVLDLVAASESVTTAPTRRSRLPAPAYVAIVAVAALVVAWLTGLIR